MANFPNNHELPNALQNELARITGCQPKTLYDGRILVMPLPSADYNRIARPKNLRLWQHVTFSIWSMFSSLPPSLDRLPEATKLGYKQNVVMALTRAKDATDFLAKRGHTASIAVVEIDWITIGTLPIALVDFGVVIEKPRNLKKSSAN